MDYLPQVLPLNTDATVADLLGIAKQVTALRAIESGDVAERHFDALGNDWDIETRADQALRPIGLTTADLNRRLAELSGGETVLVAVAGLRLRAASITLLDEPTNNLDRASRARLGELVRSWPGTLLVVSHDTVLLELMDETAELYTGRLTVFGGPYSHWRAQLDRDQVAAVRSARAAQQVVKAEKRQRIEAETKLARRAQMAKTNRQNKRAAKIVMNEWGSDADRLSSESVYEPRPPENALSKERTRPAAVRFDGRSIDSLP